MSTTNYEAYVPEVLRAWVESSCEGEPDAFTQSIVMVAYAHGAGSADWASKSALASAADEAR